MISSFYSVRSSILSLGILCFSSSALAATLNVYTFNIRFYGAKQSGGEWTQERDEKIRNFITTNMADAHALVFQEIVDVQRFYKQVVPDYFACESYQHSDHGHQHVVICLKRPFRLKTVDGDNNFAYEEVAMGNLRPAVYGVIVDGKSQPVSYIIGLHLKANPDRSEVRLQQAGLLAERIGQFQQDIPVVLLGDFNTHHDDQQLIEEQLSTSSIDFQHVQNTHAYTFRTSTMASQLDHFWTSPEVKALEPAKVLGPCNLPMENAGNRQKLAHYNADISDHCPVKAKLQF